VGVRAGVGVPVFVVFAVGVATWWGVGAGGTVWGRVSVHLLLRSEGKRVTLDGREEGRRRGFVRVR